LTIYLEKFTSKKHFFSAFAGVGRRRERVGAAASVLEPEELGVHFVCGIGRRQHQQPLRRGCGQGGRQALAAPLAQAGAAVRGDAGGGRVFLPAAAQLL